MTTVEHVGRRFYLTGLPFSRKDDAKSAGCKWCPDRRAWWTSKEDVATRIAQAANGRPAGERKPDDPDTIRLTGKGDYNGRSYFLGVSTRDGQKTRLLTLPDKDGKFLDFWKPTSEITVTKVYHPYEHRGRTMHTTLGRIARFVESERKSESRGEARCAECGRSGELVEDLEDGLMKHRNCCDIPS